MCNGIPWFPTAIFGNSLLLRKFSLIKKSLNRAIALWIKANLYKFLLVSNCRNLVIGPIAFWIPLLMQVMSEINDSEESSLLAFIITF
jgi:hypothetical protein